MRKKVWIFISLLLAAVMLMSCGAPADSAVPGQTEGTAASGTVDAAPDLGQEMQDLAVTTVDGETLTVSELLKEKKLVVLNFWFADCVWCQREFPAMELAYQRYKEDVEIIALNPYDSKADISAFRQAHSLSFPAASCSRDLALAFGINGYPTSVFIDRDGVICLIHAGAITDPNTFYNAFERFTADDYEREIYFSIDELKG